MFLQGVITISGRDNCIYIVFFNTIVKPSYSNKYLLQIPSNHAGNVRDIYIDSDTVNHKSQVPNTDFSTTNIVLRQCMWCLYYFSVSKTAIHWKHINLTLNIIVFIWIAILIYIDIHVQVLKPLWSKITATSKFKFNLSNLTV